MDSKDRNQRPPDDRRGRNRKPPDDRKDRDSDSSDDDKQRPKSGIPNPKLAPAPDQWYKARELHQNLFALLVGYLIILHYHVNELATYWRNPNSNWSAILMIHGLLMHYRNYNARAWEVCCNQVTPLIS